jgi:hypothetical protein
MLFQVEILALLASEGEGEKTVAGLPMVSQKSGHNTPVEYYTSVT